MSRTAVSRIAIALAVCSLAFPAAAFAHATLKTETPGFEQELAASPARITLGFDQFVQFPYIQVYNARGKTFAGQAVANGLNVSAPILRKLPKGAYTVRWHVLSADGHVVSGVWTFGVQVKAPPPTEAYGASGPTGTEHAVRWLYFISFALLVGPLFFRLVLLRGLDVPAPVEKRIYLLAMIGVVGAIEIGILAFCLRAEDVLQLPFLKYIYGDLTPIADDTRFGQAFIVMTLGFAFVAALVFLSWLLDRTKLLWPALGLSLALLSGLSLSGHDAVDPGSTKLTELADWVHISAGSIWIGGLLTLAVAVWPVGAVIRREAFFRFSRIAVVLVGLVLAAGIYLALVRVPHLRDLWTQRYGLVLLIKICLVSLALTWGAFHHFIVRPRLARSGEGTIGRVGRSLIGESVVGVVILLAAAILVDSKPPPRPASAPVTQAVARHR
jgi:copper transport protein